MKAFIALTAALIAGAAFAQTGDDLMKAAFGNTVAVEIPGVYEAKSYYDADHTYRTVTAEGEVKGKWRVDGDKLCLTQTEPAMAEDCSAKLAPRKVGDKWTDNSAGVELTIAIVEGRK